MSLSVVAPASSEEEPPHAQAPSVDFRSRKKKHLINGPRWGTNVVWPSRVPENRPAKILIPVSGSAMGPASFGPMGRVPWENLQNPLGGASGTRLSDWGPVVTRKGGTGGGATQGGCFGPYGRVPARYSSKRGGREQPWIGVGLLFLFFKIS